MSRLVVPALGDGDAVNQLTEADPDEALLIRLDVVPGRKPRRPGDSSRT